MSFFSQIQSRTPISSRTEIFSLSKDLDVSNLCSNPPPGLSRLLLPREDLPPGAFARYERPSHRVFVYRPQGPLEITSGEEVLVPTYEISSSIARTFEGAEIHIKRQEDQQFFEMLDIALRGTERSDHFMSTRSFSPSSAVGWIEDLGQEAVHSVISPSLWATLRDEEAPVRTKLTPYGLVGATQLFSGLSILSPVGNIAGAQTFLSGDVPKNKIYFMAHPNQIGVSPVRVDITVLNQEVVYEDLGFLLFNPQFVYQVTIS